MAYNKRITAAQRKKIRQARKQVKMTSAPEARKELVAVSRGGK